MKLYNISDIMAGYQDDTIDLADPGITTPERILSMVTGAPVSTAAPVRRAPRRAWRTALVAAVLVVALAISAFAVYQASMKDRMLDSWNDQSDGDPMVYTMYSPVGPDATAETESSPEAAPSNPEAQALAEWEEYFRTRSEDEMGELVPYEDPVRSVYGNAWSNDIAKLKEIAEKYGLRLHETRETCGWLSEFYGLTGLDGLAELTENYSGDFGCTATVYDNGSFELNAVSIPTADGTVAINITRAMKGVFCHFVVFGDEAEDYTNEIYTTADGTSVELALGHHYSMIFAELDNCYLTIFVNGGTNPSEHLDLIGMDDLKYIADNMDFSVLAQT